MKLLLEKWNHYLNELDEPAPAVVTVDFDNTLRMTDSGTANGPVITKIKELPGDTKVYIVTSRQNTDENKKMIKEFVIENNLKIAGIHLTNYAPKWYTLEEVGSDMHFDDDSKEWNSIEENLPDIKLIKVDRDTGTIKSDLEEDSEPTEPNPWSICGAEVGAKSKKYESCVLGVKAEHGIEE